MSFTSLRFFLFLALVLGCYTLSPQRLRWVVLLLASYLFYASLMQPHLLAVLAAVTAVSYLGGLLVHRAATPGGKKGWLLAGIAANLGVLVWLKYLPFLGENLNALASTLFSVTPFPALNLLVSVGVSFYVFQGIAYLVDVYLETADPEPHPGRFALAMSFFPKLLQGPIERAGTLHPQLVDLPAPSWANLQAGLNLFLFGMFKKVVVADRLAGFVDPVYSDVGSYQGISLIIATYLFALQIYFDFSGYTHMALGIARCFNVRLTENFNAPYAATSTAEFWRRWHISFSSWILDYIFKPLQMKFRDRATWGTPLALLVTFLLSGLWHGGSWCFVVWGGLHGLYLSCGLLWKGQRKGRKSQSKDKSRWVLWRQRAFTFHLVCFAWIFFRAAHIDDALQVVKSALFDLPQSLAQLLGSPDAWRQVLLLGRSPGEAVVAVGALLLALLLSSAGRRMAAVRDQVEPGQWLTGLPWWSKGLVYGVYFYLVTICGTAAQGFIYQQF